MQAQASEIEAQRRAINLQESSAIMLSIVRTDPADLETLDTVLIMLDRSCGKACAELEHVEKDL